MNGYGMDKQCGVAMGRTGSVDWLCVGQAVLRVVSDKQC